MQAGWVTWLILVTCVATALATWFGSNSLTNWLRWSSEDIVAGQWWRAITPVFLHFNVFNAIFIHVLFNCLGWLMLGGVIESHEGSRHLLLLFLLSALVSNTVGGYFYGSYFGGISGVCFALIGYVWLRGFDEPEYHRVIPPSLFYASLIYMFAGFFQIIHGMADWVHASGLATGLLAASLLVDHGPAVGTPGRVPAQRDVVGKPVQGHLARFDGQGGAGNGSSITHRPLIPV